MDLTYKGRILHGVFGVHSVHSFFVHSRWSHFVLSSWNHPAGPATNVQQPGGLTIEKQTDRWGGGRGGECESGK